MWTKAERELFNRVSTQNSQRNFKASLATSNELLALVRGNPQKFAYILGCRQAIALRHLGRTGEAEKAFSEAYDMAWHADERVIMAYILNDWSSMRRGEPAIWMIQTAIDYCQNANKTPDRDRNLEADIAYLQATLAHRLQTEGLSPLTEIRDTLEGAKKMLKKYAHGRYPRYRQAYFIVLRWNVDLPLTLSPLGLLKYAGDLGEMAMEAICQGTLGQVLPFIRR